MVLTIIVHLALTGRHDEPPSRPRALAALPVAALLTACGILDHGASDAAGGAADPLPVVAGFYPLQLAAEQVGGDRVVGHLPHRRRAEPHDLELTPQQVAAVSDAQLVLYLGAFQPARRRRRRPEAPDAPSTSAPGSTTLAPPQHAIEEAQEATRRGRAVRPARAGSTPPTWPRSSRPWPQRLSSIDPAGAVDVRRQRRCAARTG